MARLVAAALAALLLVVPSVVVAAAAPPEQAAARRRVAVLEYRGGVDSAPDLAEAIAAELRRTAALEVVDLREARRRNGKVDGEVARCAGDPACTAKAGRKLNVDEVLLVAMSQLGDLVINLQRVDVESGKAVVTPVSAVLSSPAVEREVIGPWLRQLYPPEVFVRYGRILVTANVDGAVISLNGKVSGETPLDGPITVLAPRSYRVTVTKKDRITFQARIEVLPDATVEVAADLPPEQLATPWYKRWYPWAIVGGVVAGAAAATILYIRRPDEYNNQGFVITPSPRP